MKFKSTTLVCIDCVNVKGAIRAMEKSLALCSFDDVKFFTSEETDYPHVKINKINNLAEYSLFAIKELWKHINTDYLLIVQHDGWILNPDAWDDAWYDLDYIGGNACWTDEMGGNGGFSFRTKKLMQECDKILTDPEKQYYNPEDVAISGHWDHCYRKTLIERGFKFATQKMQSTFGCDWGVWTGEFGHHKCDLKHLPQNESKKIKKAVYGSKEKNIDVTEIVRDLSGTIVVSNHIMQCDPHGGVVKDLTVWYENDNFETFKEGSYFDAGVIKRIKTKNIIKSTYGSEIKSVDVTEITRNLFDKLIGTPILNNHIMQCDPCYGIQKKIKIEFDDGTIEEVLEGGTIFNSGITTSKYDEDISFTKTFSSNRIKSSFYGTDTNKIDVTEIVRSIDSFQISNMTFGEDPHFGSIKKLMLEFENGEKDVYEENTIINLKEYDMHDTQRRILKEKSEKYFTDRNLKVYDIGSYDVNGSIKDEILNLGYNYIGVDISPGKNVDIVISKEDWSPLEDNSLSYIVSGSCLEHVEAPWEWARLLFKKTSANGICVVHIPFAIKEHRYPVDCYRILPDGLRYLFTKNTNFTELECGFSGNKQDCYFVGKKII